MKLYCTKCGGATAYTSEKPKFCSSCGTPFGGAIAAAPTRKRAEKKPLPENEYEEEDFEEDAEFVIDNLESLDVEIDTFREKGVKFGEALGAHSGQDVGDLNREADPLAVASEEEFVKQFKKEAGTINQPKQPKKKNQRNRNNGKSKT